MKTREASTLTRALTVSLVLTLFLLIVLLAITVAWRKNRDTYMVAAEQEICQPCSELQIDHQPPDGCRAEVGKCCCKGSSVIDTVVENRTKVFYDNFTYTETRERDLVYFNKNGHSIIESLRYNNGRFSISKPGFYYVFSQLKYGHDSQSMNNTNARQSHTLHRYSFRQGKREVLLEDTRTFSELHAAANDGTSFIGAVFEFHDSDQIMIKSTHTHMLSGDDLENFFSLYII